MPLGSHLCLSASAPRRLPSDILAVARSPRTGQACSGAVGVGSGVLGRELVVMDAVSLPGVHSRWARPEDRVVTARLLRKVLGVYAPTMRAFRSTVASAYSQRFRVARVIQGQVRG